ncbi:hypothetical protein J4N02_16205 [Propioniciclava sp. MC1595]|uniref:hypothetical protein n=1 Tax=Propioniciclava sp. MC1595 TaxID=2760308 RepID=UPI0016625DCD|nr:hypothetical protein [Propioniciclava sp. MC1595]MBB1496479.1 hypothetical protein [Propioniciclava sp. MC1595]QTE25998.1 hypothetical protein J4N02_16205 [Propioniciclava sp. MC1595]
MTDGDMPSPVRPNRIDSPPLAVAEDQHTVVWDESYPGPKQIDELAVLDDWLETVDQALVEARNGVTAISWPFAVGGLLALLAVLADAIDSVGSGSLVTLTGWIDLFAASPARLTVCAILAAFSIAAFKLAGQGSEARRTLVALRSAYLRRRRQLDI